VNLQSIKRTGNLKNF